MIQTLDQQLYLRKLLGFQFRIEYKVGRTNSTVDALSCVHETIPEDDINTSHTCLSFNSQPSIELLQSLLEENTTPPGLISLYQKFLKGKLSVSSKWISSPPPVLLH